MTEIQLLNPFKQKAKIRDIWIELQQYGSQSYFTSWGWVETWLTLLPVNTPLCCVVEFQDKKPLSAFFLARRRILQYGFLPKNVGYFNEVGDLEIDDLTIEYNSPVGGNAKSLLDSLFNHPAISRLDEIRMSALDHQTFDQLEAPSAVYATSYQQFPSYYVDLQLVRESGRSYLQHLSANTRSKIGRSLREYENSGDIYIREAESIDEALAMLSELRQLHQLRWNQRGKPGSFATEFFNSFHQQLIQARFDNQEIQLLEIGNNSGAIGYIYNFVHNNRVNYYQSGFNYGNSNSERPGLVCHFHAINLNLEEGRDIYDFLGGDSRYKRSLSTDHESLFHVKISRKNSKWKLEQFLRLVLGKSR